MNYTIVAAIVNGLTVIAALSAFQYIHPLAGGAVFGLGGWLTYRIGIEEGKTIAAAFVRREVDRIIAEIELDNE